MGDAAAATAVLRVDDLHKRYGERPAVNGVSFTVRRGEIVGLLGPNGAGKTTTINMLLGVLEPSAGRIHIEGVDLARHRARALAHTNFAAVYAPLPGNLSVEHNLRFFGAIYDVPQLGARIDALLGQFDLMRFRHSKCGVLSSGEQTRVALAKALLNRPRLLFLDEPTASVDPATAQGLREQIRQVAQAEDSAVLWTSHNMYEMEAVCDRVLFMAAGRILLDGRPQDLLLRHEAASLEELFLRVAREPAELEGPP